jgi:hypothetical protein
LHSSAEKPPSNSTIIILYILGLIFTGLTSLDIEDPGWTIAFFCLIIVVIGSWVAVYKDAKKLGEYAKSKGKTSPLSPRTWLVATILIWIIAVPVYLYRKSRAVRSL